MTLLPEHAQLLARVRHRELVQAAEEHRRGRLAGWWGQLGEVPDCRVPTAPATAAPPAAACRPDPRSCSSRPAGRHRPAGRTAGGRALRALWGHWPGRSRTSR